MGPHSLPGNTFGFNPLLINVHSMRRGLLEIKWCLIRLIKWIYNQPWIHPCLWSAHKFLKTPPLQICPLVFPLLAAGYLSKSPHVRPYLPNFEAMPVKRLAKAAVAKGGLGGQPLLVIVTILLAPVLSSLVILLAPVLNRLGLIVAMLQRLV